MARIKTFSNAGTILPTDLNSIQDYIDSQDAANTTADELLRTIVGANNIAGSVVRRGKSIINTTGSRSNTAYGFLSDANDRVQNVVLPADGLICVAFQATWQEAVSGAARAAIFLGANQLKLSAYGGGPFVQEASIGGTVATDGPLATFGFGLAGAGASSAAGADVTTGQLIGNNSFSGGGFGGFSTIFAASGTYDISVQFKASSGSVTAKNRKLWVWTINF